MSFYHQPEESVYGFVVKTVKQWIVTGIYPPGKRIPSVPELSTTLQVNPSALSAALQELAQIGLLEQSDVGVLSVTKNVRVISIAKYELATTHLEEFLTRMRELKCTDEQITSMLVDHSGLFGGEEG